MKAMLTPGNDQRQTFKGILGRTFGVRISCESFIFFLVNLFSNLHVLILMILIQERWELAFSKPRLGPITVSCINFFIRNKGNGRDGLGVWG